MRPRARLPGSGLLMVAALCVTLLVGNPASGSPAAPRGASSTVPRAAPPLTWTKVPPAAGSPPASADASMVYDAADGYDLMFGGTLGNATWAYAGGRWTQLHPTTHPPARAWPALTYDARHRYVLLFGGLFCGYGQPCTDTWEFRAGNWTQRNPATAPHPSYWVSMAYDPVDRYVVLFARSSGTWQWTGTDWVVVNTSVVPLTGKYMQYQMAFDPRDGYVVLAARSNFTCGASGRYCMMTASYVHGAWTQLANDSALQAGAWSMAYDPALGRLVLYGAQGRHFHPSQTWTFRGGRWTRVAPSRSPPRRMGGVVGYDRAGRDLVLFGTNGATWTFG